jgi:hypothetical protein
MRVTLAWAILGVALIAVDFVQTSLGEVPTDQSGVPEPQYHMLLAAGILALVVAGARMVRARMRPRKSDWAGSPDAYTQPSFRGAILMLVVSLVVIVIVWLAYGWALGVADRAGVPT